MILVPFDEETAKGYGSLYRAIKAFHDGDVFLDKETRQIMSKNSLPPKTWVTIDLNGRQIQIRT